jgi:hypothetical protein
MKYKDSNFISMEFVQLVKIGAKEKQPAEKLAFSLFSQFTLANLL